MNGQKEMDGPVANDADDVSLLRMYVERNDHEALGFLFTRHSNMAYRTALRVLRDASSAEDAVQAAFVEIMRDAPTYRGGQGVRVWIMKMVTNICRNMIREAVRRRNREDRVVEENGVPERGGDLAQELTELVRRSLDKLPEQYRMPVWLHHYEGMSFQEVAGVLSAPENTVRSYASRGIAELRKNLARTVAAVPSISIVTALTSIPCETAPATLVNSIGDIVAGMGEFSPAAVAAKGLTAAKAASTGMSLKVAVGIGLVAASAAVVGVVWMASSRTNPAASPGPGGGADGAVLGQWKFDSPEPPAGLTVLQGSWRHTPGGGPDGSGCMEITSPSFLAVLDAPTGESPVLITYRARPIMKPPFETQPSLNFIWTEHGQAAVFSGVGQSQTFPVTRDKDGSLAVVTAWLTRREYLTERATDLWENGRRVSCSVVEKKRQSRLGIWVQGNWLIDDLCVRTIAQSEVPDVRSYLDAVEEIAPEKRAGVVALPQLKPGKPGGQVMVKFLP